MSHKSTQTLTKQVKT